MEEALKLRYDHSKIEWEYEERKYQQDISGIEYAYVQGKYICAEIYKNSRICYCYINIDNRKVICYDEYSKQILIDGKPAVTFKNRPYGVDINDDGCIYVLVDDSEMRLYDENGKYKNSIMSPKGYKYYRFFSVQDGISVICQGDISNADRYGRNDWKFKYNDGTWSKENLAY